MVKWETLAYKPENFKPEAYQRQLREGHLFLTHPMLIAQKMRSVGLRWLRLAVQTSNQVAEAILVDHYISVLPFKPKN